MSVNQQRLVNLLDRVIGSAGIKLQKQGEYIWFCPFHPHHKPKLQINIDPSLKVFQRYHCWVCNRKGRSLFSLFKQLNASSSQFQTLSELVGKSSLYSTSRKQPLKKNNVIKLPAEFKPLWVNNSSPSYKHAINYLKKRNLLMHDIIKYGIGYCDQGPYKNRIIIPSYDENGDLNFFSGRDFYDNPMKYKNCDSTKDIIGFDFFINWNEDIILAEGPFDAFAIKRNVIPLFGKTMGSNLKKKILKKKVKRIYVSLDTDAIIDSLKIIEDFMGYGISVYFVKLSDGDPSEIGFSKMINIIKNTPETEFSDLMRLKLNGNKTTKYMEIL